MTPAARAQQKVRVERILRAFGARALALYRRLAAGRPDRRCGSCAFREMERHGVDGWKGWDSSLAGLAFVAGGKKDVFVCHVQKRAGGPWRPHHRPRICAGYAVLAGRPELEQAICEAAIDAEVGAA